MTINVFFHKIEDVGYFFTKIYDEKEKYDFFTTHAGVMEYCINRYKVHIILISSLFSEDDIQQITQTSQKKSYALLQELDDTHAKQLSDFFHADKIDFFLWLYSYYLPFVLDGLLVFEQIIQRVGLDKKNIVFNYKESFYNTFDLKSYLDSALNDKKINISIDWHETKIKSSNNKWEIVKKSFNSPKKALSRIVEYIAEYISYKSKSKNKTVIYMDNLYDLTFIKFKLFRLIPYSYNALQHKFGKTTAYQKIPSIENLFFTDNLCETKVEFMKSSIIKHFTASWKNYYIGLKNLQELVSENNIHLAVWGNPPVTGFKALFYAFLKSKNIPIIGMQHGSGYVAQKYEYHYYSDFMRCDYYLSYGFTQRDYETVFKKDKPTILPFGTTKVFAQPVADTKLDVLFPITNTFSLFDGGFARVKPDTLHEEQKMVLKMLEEYANNKALQVLVKPFMNTSLWETSVFDDLKKLKHSRVEFSLPLIDVLQRHSPKCIIIEFLSTPLYEVLPLDTEIFLLVHEADNLTEKAREMLEKRVHIVANFDELKVIFQKWIEKNLPEKRDSSYYNYYVHKDNSKSNILELLKNV